MLLKKFLLMIPIMKILVTKTVMILMKKIKHINLFLEKIFKNFVFWALKIPSWNIIKFFLEKFKSFLRLELETFISPNISKTYFSKNIRNFLILGLESSISQKIWKNFFGNFFRLDCFYFYFYFFSFFELGMKA